MNYYQIEIGFHFGKIDQFKFQHVATQRNTLLSAGIHVTCLTEWNMIALTISFFSENLKFRLVDKQEELLYYISFGLNIRN